LLTLHHLTQRGGATCARRLSRINPAVTRKLPGISVAELRERLSHQPTPVLVDVREPWEYAQAHVAEARLIPLGELERRVGEIPRDRPILAICHSGQRSHAAAAYLMNLGYPDVANVEGGTAAWIERGFPVAR
jgi:rhodanese-related sulfurtransferase